MTSESQDSIWSGYYKKSLLERQNQLKSIYPSLFPKESTDEAGEERPNTWPFQGLDERLADLMTENCIGYVFPCSIEFKLFLVYLFKSK